MTVSAPLAGDLAVPRTADLEWPARPVRRATGTSTEEIHACAPRIPAPP